MKMGQFILPTKKVRNSLYHENQNGTLRSLVLFADCDEDYIGDGFCDDALNIPQCNFDVGDCCLPNTITDFCFECQCFNKDNYVTPLPFWKTTTVEPTSNHHLVLNHVDFKSTLTK